MMGTSKFFQLSANPDAVRAGAGEMAEYPPEAAT